MKYLVRFLLVLGLGLAVLWAAVGKEGIFPSREKPDEEPPVQGPHVPAIRVNQGGGAISMAPRGKLNIRSSRARKLPDGSILQVLRYSLRSANAQPNPDGTYTLYKAVLTFYKGLRRPVPAALIRARKMTLSMVTGKEGIRPMENQEMSLAGVRVETGEAFQGGALRLETERLLVETTKEETRFRTPAPDTPFVLSGLLAGGDFEMKGLGLEGALPAPETEGGKGGPPPGGNSFFHFLGRSKNRGTWKKKGGGTVRFSCSGPFLLERGKGGDAVRVALERKVQVERDAPGGPALLSASTLKADFLPSGEDAAAEGMKPGGRLRRLFAAGSPMSLESQDGKFHALEMTALFDMDGSFLAMKARGKPSVSGKRPDGTTFLAECPGPMTLVSLEKAPLLFGPLLSLPGTEKALPASLVTLSGPAGITLSGKEGPGSLQAEEGIRILLSRGKEILSLAGFGPTRIEAPGLKGSTDQGITLVQAPFFASSGRARTLFHSPGLDAPARFSVAAEGKGDKGGFTLEGIGFLERESYGGDKTVLLSRAAGPRGYLRARASTSRGKVLLDGASGLRVVKTGKEEAEITAWRDFPGFLRAAFPARGVTAWAARLEGKGRETRLFGREGEPLLLTAPVEDKEGGSTRMRLLAGEALLQEGKTLLHAVKGVKLRFQGKSLLPGAEGGTTTLSAREMFLFAENGGEKPAAALLSGNVAILVERDKETTRGKGRDLWISLGRKRAVLSGSPARIHAVSGEGRSLTVLSEIIRLSREETVAGDLASGIGGKILMESSQGAFGAPAARGSRIEAVCGMPIHLKGDFLVFPGACILKWIQKGVPPDQTPTLICGSMVAKKGPGGGQPFLWIRGKNGVKFKKGVFQGTGESLYFQPGPGTLRMEGGKENCRFGIGDLAFQGKRITLNIHDFTWKVEDSFSRRVPLAASVGTHQGGIR